MIWADQAGGTQESMRPAAIASLLGYTIGLPAAFFTILVVHRTAIFQDQTLRQANQGNSPTTNPNFSIRKRYKELYVGGGRLAVLRVNYFQMQGTHSGLVCAVLCACRYSLFRPELYWWRMVLTLRKFCEVAVALLFSSAPLFQAW
jgi:hypothetical protein